MCYRPLRIANPSRFYHSDQPKYISVPCGYCEDCRRVTQNEWFFRAYMEYMDCIGSGGAVYFPTLTYDDDHLPSVELPVDDDILRVGCFSTEHIRSMMRKMRVYLQRDGYEYKGLKYIVCSEFGDTKGRPHYHMLLFIPFPLSTDYVLDLLRKSWVNGFVGVPRFGLKLTDIRGVRYAMKYVTKDICFYDIRDVYNISGETPVRTRFSMRDYLATDDDSLKRYRKELCKGVLPFHRQSLGFGSCFLNKIHERCLNDDDLVRFLVDDKWKLCDGQSGVFPIPKYYHRKIERIIDEETSKLVGCVRQKFSEVGSKVKVGRLYESFIRTAKDIKGINQPYIDTQLPENVPVGVKISDIKIYLADRDEIRSELANLIKSVDVNDFVLYRMLLRYTPCDLSETYDSAFLSLPTIVENIVNSKCSDLDVFTIYGYGENVATPIKYKPALKGEITYSDLECFSRFERLCKLLDRFMVYVNLQKNEKLYQDNKKCKETKSKYRKYTVYESYKDIPC